MEHAVAARISRVARPGDVVLAPPRLSKALLILDARVTAVAPRLMYTKALPATPEARRTERLELSAFASHELQPDPREDRVVAALREPHVDTACVPERAVRAVRLLAAPATGRWSGCAACGAAAGPARDGAALDRLPRELGALVVLRHVADPEAVEQHVQVALDGVDAHEEGIRDLPVRRRSREAIAEQRAA